MKSIAENIVELKKNILVVEDDEDVSTLMREALEDAGYVAIPAYDGAQAIKLLEEREPDMIVLDLMLPDLDGIEIIKRKQMREAMERVPTLIVSARADLNTKMASFTGGAKRYMTKPFSVEDLIREVKSIFRQREITEKVFKYRDACSPPGDFGAFPSAVDRETENCIERAPRKEDET